ncbi:MAG: hypothetical protein J0L64_16725 [Acidobacteria bacterium]|nr:hypothetical protein [Acidobacteriota bacterium]
MSLLIRTLLIRIGTAEGLVGVRLDFDDKLNVIHAPNTMGKSICVNAIIYGLGLEGMLSASYDAPFPPAVTDSIIVDGKAMSVVSSEILLEISNRSGETATIRRAAAGKQNRNLVSVWDGATVSKPDAAASQRDYFVRVGGAARREAGFHYWLAGFMGWKLPMVPTFREEDSPLYLECIFPMCIIEQKRGWAGFLSRIPTHFRIRDVDERAIEFLLALDTYGNSIARQRLREEQRQIKTEWQNTLAALSSAARTINGVVNGVPGEPGSVWPPQPAPQMVVPNGDRWIAARQGLQGARTALQELQAKPAANTEVRIEQLQTELRTLEHALRRDDYVLDEYLSELEQQREALENVDRRLAAIDQDLRRNKDTKRLREFGSVLPLHVSQGECPTCQQPLQDSLLPQVLAAAPMSLVDNIAFIEAQKATFNAMRQNTLRLVAAKEARFEAHQTRVEQKRTDIRMLRQTLMGERVPEEREIRQRLQLEEWIQKAESALGEFDGRLQQFSELATDWANIQAALKDLPEGDHSAADVSKLSALEKSMRQQLREYRFESLAPDSLWISHDTFRPEHEKFEFEVTTSASDLIRMIWAYVNGLMEVARSQPTNHPGVLVMDEPKQQGAHRRDLGTFLRRLAACGRATQQVIITTSEEADTFAPLVQNLDCKVFDFEAKILQPLR